MAGKAIVGGDKLTISLRFERAKRAVLAARTGISNFFAFRKIILKSDSRFLH